MRMAAALLSAMVLIRPAGLLASDFVIPKGKQAPAPTASAPSMEPLMQAYADYYSALAAYSDKAFSLDQSGPEYYEAQARGSYLRARVEELSFGILKAAASDPLRRQAFGGGAGSR